MDFKKIFAEFLGTFLFFTIGAGAILSNIVSNGAVGLLGIAIAHGLALAIMVSAFGYISGGHFNPAVTFGMMLTKNISIQLGILYIVAQILGGALSGIVLRGMFAMDITPSIPAVATTVTFGQAILIEAVTTFALVTSVFGTAVDSRSPKIGGFGIGLTLFICILVAGPLTGGALNPARVAGPALVAGFWNNHLVYWIGPLIGGGLAALVYNAFVMEKK